MDKPTVLVTGANGRTGRAVVRALSASGAHALALIRQKDQAPSLLANGAIQCHIGDLADIDSLHAALVTCDALVFIGPPMHPSEVQFVDNAIAAANRRELGHFIYYSVMHPLRREVRHHRLKLDAEERVVESGLAYTILQPCRYMQHLELQWQTVRDEGVHRMPFSTKQRFNVVDLLDVAEVVARVAAEGSEHHFATYELAGPEALSQDEMAAILSTALSRNVRAEEVSLKTLRETAQSKGLTADRIDQMVTMNQHYDAHGFLGNSNVLCWLLGRPPTTYGQYVQRLLKQA